MSDAERALRAPAREPAISDGYPAVSRFISSDLDGESYVFRKFRTLTARKLLYMQSQILELEEQLADFDRAAAASPDWELHLAARSWERLIANAESREKEKQIRKVIDEIEVKLDNYHRALLLQSQVARVETPPDRVLSAYKDALLSSDGKDALLGGKAQYVLDDADDLAMLSPPKSNDAISHFLRNHWFFKTRDHYPPADQHRTRYFEERSLTWIVNACSTLIAATLLIGSILALYFVHDSDARLGIVLGFIVLFALGLSLTTSANRDAIFAATAAYAAVLIVYISGDAVNDASKVAAIAACNATVPQ